MNNDFQIHVGNVDLVWNEDEVEQKLSAFCEAGSDPKSKESVIFETFFSGANLESTEKVLSQLQKQIVKNETKSLIHLFEEAIVTFNKISPNNKIELSKKIDTWIKQAEFPQLMEASKLGGGVLTNIVEIAGHDTSSQPISKEFKKHAEYVYETEAEKIKKDPILKTYLDTESSKLTGITLMQYVYKAIRTDVEELPGGKDVLKSSLEIYGDKLSINRLKALVQWKKDKNLVLAARKFSEHYPQFLLNELEKTTQALARVYKLDIKKYPELLTQEQLFASAFRTWMNSHPEELKTVTRLGFQQEGLNELPVEFCQCTELTSIEFGNNKLRILPEAVSNWTKIQDVDFSNNKLETLPKGVSKWTLVHKVHFGRNNINIIPKAVGTWTKVWAVNFQGNKLKDLPDEIGNWTLVARVNFTKNEISILPKAVGKWSQLSIVNFDDNLLSSLPDEVVAWTQVRFVHFRGNKISVLPKTVGSWTQLTSIHLENNDLKKLPREVGNWTQVVDVNLTFNDLDSLPDTAIANWIQVQNVELDDNPNFTVQQKMPWMEL